MFFSNGSSKRIFLELFQSVSPLPALLKETLCVLVLQARLLLEVQKKRQTLRNSSERREVAVAESHATVKCTLTCPRLACHCEAFGPKDGL